MCLILRQNDNDKPYNSSKFRWKVCQHFGKKSGGCYGPYVGSRYFNKRWNRAKVIGRPGFDGFHVFVTKADAKDEVRSLKDISSKGSLYSIKKIEVSGFLASGAFYSARSETWRRFRFAE